MSVIGHGDIASVLKDREDLVFFAAGVSNSLETRETEYEREMDLLDKISFNNHVVYFSSLCVFYRNVFDRYTAHKRYMEELVKHRFWAWTILRLGNITWGKNPHTLINFIKNKIGTRQPVEIRDEYRYIIDLDEFLHWIDLIPPWSCEINIVGKRMKVKDIVREYCYPWRNIDAIVEYAHSESELQICQQHG